MVDLSALLALLSQNTRGKSTSLNIMDNPLALALAGVYDEAATMQQEPEFSSLVQEFATSDSPAMQMVWDAIEKGLNPYALRSFIDTQITPEMVAETGYLSDDFKNAAVGAATDYQKALVERDKNDPWAKLAQAGWRRPSERYTLEDVPVPEALVAEDVKRQQRWAETSGGVASGEAELRSAFNNLKKIQEAQKLSNKEMVDYINQAGGNIDPQSYDADTGDIYRTKSSKKKWYNPLTYTLDPLTTTVGRVAEDIIQDFTSGGKGRRKNVEDIYKQMFAKQNADKVRAGMSRSAKASRDVESSRRNTLAARLEAEDLRQAAMDAAVAQGRTPFRDQAAVLMQFWGR